MVVLFAIIIVVEKNSSLFSDYFKFPNDVRNNVIHLHMSHDYLGSTSDSLATITNRAGCRVCEQRACGGGRAGGRVGGRADGRAAGGLASE